MSLQHELKYPYPIESKSHETALAVVLTGILLQKEAYFLLRPLGLTDSQFNVLMLLKYQCPDEGLNQSQLGEMLLVNRSNVTGLLDRMERAGWITREKTPGDRRSHEIRLTANGRRLLSKAEKIYMERIEGILKSLSADQQSSLCNALHSIRDGLEIHSGRGSAANPE